MAKTSNFVGKKVKFKVQEHNQCMKCGRTHGFLRKFGICRICFREFVYKGYLPGVKKASW